MLTDINWAMIYGMSLKSIPVGDQNYDPQEGLRDQHAEGLAEALVLITDLAHRIFPVEMFQGMDTNKGLRERLYDDISNALAHPAIQSYIPK